MHNMRIRLSRKSKLISNSPIPKVGIKTDANKMIWCSDCESLLVKYWLKQLHCYIQKSTRRKTIKKRAKSLWSTYNKNILSKALIDLIDSLK